MDLPSNSVHDVRADGDARVHVGNIIHATENRCLADLRVTDPRHDKKRIEETKGGLLVRCYDWVLANPEFQQWRYGEESRLLWIRGDPGKGKTMLLCGIIDELDKADKGAAVYFFCQGTDARINNAISVLRGLLYLLLDRQPCLLRHVQDKHKIAGKALFTDINAWVALCDIFADILRDPSLRPTYLIIDALDECQTDLPNLLAFIVSHATASTRIKWAFTSRNRLAAEESLVLPRQGMVLNLELNAMSVFAAVDFYVQEKVRDLAVAKGYDLQARTSLRSYLLDNADGTFLWVALVCQNLKKVRATKVLEQLTAFPRGLDTLYERMMQQILRMGDSDDVDFCTRILATAATAYRPLTLEELASMGTDNIASLFEVVQLCGSFLVTRERTVFFVHQSAKDFLLNSASHLILPSGVERGHCAIFSKSLNVLSRMLRRDPYSLRRPGFPIDLVSAPEPDPLAPIHYSCIYWVNHLRDSHQIGRHEDLIDGGSVDRFLKEKYLYWLEAVSLLRSMPEGVMAIRNLEDIVRSAGSRRLIGLTRDALRFVLFHGASIEVAPLQAYASALIFSPVGSEIRELFAAEMPDWVRLKPEMEESWSACLQTLEGHVHTVQSVAVSADMLASSSSDTTVKVWDPATGACLQTIEGHSSSVWSVTFSAYGRWLASASADATVRLWDPATGACLQTLEGHIGSVWSVAFSAGGQLASASDDTLIKLWDPAAGTCLRTLEGHSKPVRSVAFSPHGRLASAGGDWMIKLWDPVTGACLRTLAGHTEQVLSVTFSADGRQLASASEDGTVKVWDPATGTCLQTLEGHGDGDGGKAAQSVAFSTDGQLASTGYDNIARLWDIATGECLKRIEGDSRCIGSIAFLPDCQRLVSGGPDTTVRLWDLSEPLPTLETHIARVTSVAFSVDGSRLASASYEEVKLWNPDTGSCLQTLDGHISWVMRVAFSIDGQQLASAGEDKTVKLWDPVTGACQQTLDGHSSYVSSVAFSPDGMQVASTSAAEVKLWDTRSGQCIQMLGGDSHWLSSVAFSADGRWVASGSWNNTTKLWDTISGQCVQTLVGHSDRVTSVALSPDGTQVASVSKDQTVKLWDTPSGRCIQTLEVRSRRPQMAEVVPQLDKLSFLNTSSWLNTDIGIMDLSVPSMRGRVRPSSATTVRRPMYRRGYGISVDGKWVMRDSEPVLWLPLEYRPGSSAVAGSTVAIGCASGRVLVMRFAALGPDGA